MKSTMKTHINNLCLKNGIEEWLVTINATVAWRGTVV